MGPLSGSTAAAEGVGKAEDLVVNAGIEVAETSAGDVMNAVVEGPRLVVRAVGVGEELEAAAELEGEVLGVVDGDVPRGDEDAAVAKEVRLETMTGGEVDVAPERADAASVGPAHGAGCEKEKVGQMRWLLQ